VDGDGNMELVLNGDKAGTEAPANAYGVMTDQSLASKSGSVDRYYIDGKTFNGWENVPDEYKSEIKGTDVANPNDAGFKLNFK